MSALQQDNEILRLNNAALATERIDPEAEKIKYFYNEAIDKVLANEHPANAGEWIKKLGERKTASGTELISEENFRKLLD